ncbi:MAG: MBL fold metallo-hydrolase [Kofleriaceae bacterium]|nr:MBL fold metallo-hydrolase [Kofleriaceae bacterium]
MKRSPQWRGGTFVNTLPKRPVSVSKALLKLLRGNGHAQPVGAIPIVERSADDYVQAPESGLRVTWLGHSTSLIEIDGRRLLLDPVWSERASPFARLGPKRFHRPPLALGQLPALDAVLISHDHYDHLDHRTIAQLATKVPLFVVPLGVGAHLVHWGVAKERIVELDWWQEHKLDELVLTATPARHFSGRSVVMANQDSTLWAGWAIAGHTHRVFFSGDSGLCPEFAEIGERLGPFDLTLMETGAYDPLWPDVHMGPEQAITAHQMLRGGLFVPVHWGTFKLASHGWTEPVERLMVAAKEAGVVIAVPRPGALVEPANFTEVERWWPLLPWQGVDETRITSTGLDSEEQPTSYTGTRPSACLGKGS